MRYISLFLCFAMLLSGCAPAQSVPAGETRPPVQTVPSTAEPPSDTEPEQDPPDLIEALISAMTIEERVGQLFLARCNAATALQDIETYHLGGFVLFSEDFDGQTPDSMRAILASYQAGSAIPMLMAVDEEGGSVTRISRYPAFRESRLPSPRTAFRQGGMTQALQNEDEKCRLLASLDINVNLGPVCDISTDPDSFMYHRSLGQDPHTTAEFVMQTVALMRDYDIGSVLKHFPGYGGNVDTHTGIAVDSRSLETLEAADLIPFTQGIQAGCGAVLVSHTIVEAMDPSAPASLSPAVHAYLRQELGFNGVILTDDLAMEAITDRYGAAEAAVLAVLAGNDLLCSTDYATQYAAIVDAVVTERISLDTLNRAVYRVLLWKKQLGLLNGYM